MVSGQAAEPALDLTLPRGAAIQPRRRPRLPPALRPRIALPALVVAAIVACALAPAWIAPFDPTDMDAEAILQAPGPVHWLGTDHFGRDVLSLVIHGARQSLLMGACAVGLGGLIGGIIGLVSGYAGRVVDMVLMRFVDIWMAVPDILLAIVIAAALGASLGNTILAVGLVTVPRYARVMRAQVIAVRGRPFIEASRSIGSSHGLILLRHILPHTLSSMLVMATLGIANAILIGASLSFIGLGVIDDRPDWGFLLSQGRSYLTVAWWFATFPGLAITALVISVNLLGDALRNRFDPRLRAG
ncbi:ABC transporter permease [Inquilinus limosus]|uniref:D-ala-D-ala transporter subunit n=1 Tax=Inquilinus limosus TaxID=171674 RepID=A0A211ZVS4_9PROT|nr:ABC transporter permease [Inquilinus limosus]OWJ69177.1 D-ala-D-ala transporter subunit [Inquilinus limosus]